MTDVVRQIANAVLYEGHVLWPYRRSSIKNRQRWTFGGVYPEAYARSSSDRSAVQVRCLVEGDAPAIEVEVRFLQVVHRQATRGPAWEAVDEIAGYLTWEETTERSIELGGAQSVPIDIPSARAVEHVEGGALVRSWERLEGRVETLLDPLGGGLHRAHVRIVNTSDWPGLERAGAIARTLLSAHAVLRVRGGSFVSSIDPPDNRAEAVFELASEGLWPVLVGEEGDRSTMLAAPIILSDYARVAPESPGDFFDGGEIDQLLVLNILGMTEDEKREMRAGDPRAREILERTEAMTDEQMAQLNGVVRP
jgi:hypothetical protein